MKALWIIVAIIAGSFLLIIAIGSTLPETESVKARVFAGFPGLPLYVRQLVRQQSPSTDRPERGELIAPRFWGRVGPSQAVGVARRRGALAGAASAGLATAAGAAACTGRVAMRTSKCAVIVSGPMVSFT